MVISTALVAVPEIFDLRWSVLRAGMPRESAVFPEDSGAGTFHVAAYDEHGALRGCGTFFPDPLPTALLPASGQQGGSAESGGAAAYRFRGMASAPEVRGRGFGHAVLEAGLTEVAKRGGAYVWCNGRTPATAFYERQGFTRVGEEFVLGDAGPHYVFVRRLDT